MFERERSQKGRKICGFKEEWEKENFFKIYCVKSLKKRLCTHTHTLNKHTCKIKYTDSFETI